MQMPRIKSTRIVRVIATILIIIVPIGLYYFFYAKSKRQYYNQRNFRALNEVISQIENHFKALDRLFLFSPVSFGEKAGLPSTNDRGEALYDAEQPTPAEKIDGPTTKKLSEKRKQLYARRLQLNDFFENLSVEEKLPTTTSQFTEQFARVCATEPQSTIFTIDLGSSSIDVKAYRCKKKDDIDRADNPRNGVLEEKTVVDDELLPNGSPTTPTKLLKNSFEDYYFSVPLRSLFIGREAIEFDSIILASKQGQVLYQKDLKVLRWAEDISILQPIGTGTRATNIGWIIDQALNQGDGAPNSDNPHSTSSGSTEVNPGEINRSVYIPLSFAGTNYLAYVQPFKLPFHVYPVGGGLDYQDNSHQKLSEFYIIGLVEKSRFDLKALSVPIVYSAIAFLLLVVGILAWPFLKLRFIGSKQAITVGDFRFLFISLTFSMVLATSFIVSMTIYSGMEQAFDRLSKHIAEQIEQEFIEDLSIVLQHLDRAKRIFKQLPCDSESMEISRELKDCQDTLQKPSTDPQSVFSCLPNDRYWEDRSHLRKIRSEEFPPLRDIFAVDHTGQQVGPIIYLMDGERLYGARRLNISFRDYFRKPRDGVVWQWHGREGPSEQALDDNRFYIQRIYNFSDGQKASQVAMPLKSECPLGLRKEPVVIAATAYFPTFAVPVVPPSFNFAVVETETGEILYHYQDEKSFIENLFTESDQNNDLMALVRSNHRGQVRGRLHAVKTNFHVKPLKNVPWTLVVYYDANRLQIFTVKTALVAAFEYFLLIAAVGLLVVIPARALKFNLKWLWPHPKNATTYAVMIPVLVLFLVLYYQGVLLFDGWKLFAFLILALLVHGSLLWLFLGDRDSERVRLLEWLAWVIVVIFFALLIVYQVHARIVSYSLILVSLTWFISLTVGLKMVRSSNTVKASTPKDSCARPCRIQYLIFISLCFAPHCILSVLALYKDSFTANFERYSKINQLDVADAMQRRAFSMEKFAKMFFLGKYDLPGANQRLSLSATNGKSKAIFGMQTGKQDKVLCLELTFGKFIPRDGFEEICQRPERQSELRKGGAKIPSSPAELFLQVIPGVNLMLAQQSMVSTAELHPDKGEWRDNGLFFVTEDSAGSVDHWVSALSPDFFGLTKNAFVLRGDPNDTGPTALAWLVVILVVLFWWAMLNFFTRKVLGVEIPEPMAFRHTVAVLSRWRILIRASDWQLRQLYSELDIKEPEQIKKIDVLTEETYSLSDLEASAKHLVLVENLEAAIGNPIKRRKLLKFLEDLVEKDSGLYAFHVFICGEIGPLYRLTNPQAYPYQRGSTVPAPKMDSEEVYRWARLLAQFEKQYFWPTNDNAESSEANCEKDTSFRLIKDNSLMAVVKRECRIWPELQKIEKDLAAILTVHHANEKAWLTRDQIVEYVKTHASAFYRRRWELCTRDERLLLYQLANDKFINPYNLEVIKHLYRRGYIERDPYFKVANDSFKHYIVSAELVENFAEWEREAAKSIWADLKVPLFVTLVFLTGLLIYIASDTIEVTLGLLTALVGFVPVLLRVLGTVRAAAGEPQEPAG